jgi:hypothetical protein
MHSPGQVEEEVQGQQKEKGEAEEDGEGLEDTGHLRHSWSLNDVSENVDTGQSYSSFSY